MHLIYPQNLVYPQILPDLWIYSDQQKCSRNVFVFVKKTNILFFFTSFLQVIYPYLALFKVPFVPQKAFLPSGVFYQISRGAQFYPSLLIRRFCCNWTIYCFPWFFGPSSSAFSPSRRTIAETCRCSLFKTGHYDNSTLDFAEKEL